MFWGLIMEPKRRYTQVVKKPFHVSMAALDGFSSSENPCQVMLIFEGRNYLLCTLQKDKTMQCALDLNFETGDKVILATNGDSNVHLTGYLVEEDMNMLEEAEDEEEDEEEKVEPTGDNESNKKKRKVGKPEQQPPKKKSKTEKLLDEADNYDSNDDESFSLSKALEDDNLEESDEDSDDEAEEQDDEEDNTDEEEDEDDEEEQESDEFSSLSDKEDEKAQVKPQMNGVSSKRKQKEAEKQNKQKKVKGEGEKAKNEKTKGEKSGNVVKTPNKQNKIADDSLQKENKTPKADKTPKSNKKEDSPVKSPQQNAGSPQKRTLEGGLIIHDVVVGEGPVIKPGKLAFVYYEGRLKQNNKLFDKKLQGAPFKFRLGKQEVIKGWDVGVSGMKVGGKRKIICPPNMAYGSKGSPPEIPPNSTLVFEVELKNVK